MKVKEMIKEVKSYKARFIHAHVILIREDKVPHDAEHYYSINEIPKVKSALEVNSFNVSETLLIAHIE